MASKIVPTPARKHKPEVHFVSSADDSKPPTVLEESAAREFLKLTKRQPWKSQSKRSRYRVCFNLEPALYNELAWLGSPDEVCRRIITDLMGGA